MNGSWKRSLGWALFVLSIVFIQPDASADDSTCRSTPSSGRVDGCITLATRGLEARNFYKVIENVVDVLANPVTSPSQTTRAKAILAAALSEADRPDDASKVIDELWPAGNDIAHAPVGQLSSYDRAIALFAKMQLQARVSSLNVDSALAAHFSQDFANGLKANGQGYPSVGFALSALGNANAIGSPTTTLRLVEAIVSVFREIPNAASIELANAEILEAFVAVRANALADAGAELDRAEKSLPLAPWLKPLLRDGKDEDDDRHDEASKIASLLWRHSALLRGCIAMKRGQTDFALERLNLYLLTERKDDWQLFFMGSPAQQEARTQQFLYGSDSGASVDAARAAIAQWSALPSMAEQQLHWLRLFEAELLTGTTIRVAQVSQSVLRSTYNPAKSTEEDPSNSLFYAYFASLGGADYGIDARFTAMQVSDLKSATVAQKAQALAILAGLDARSGSLEESRQELSTARELSKSLDGRWTDGHWVTAMYARIAGDTDLERNALEMVVRYIVKADELYDLLAYWRYSELQVTAGNYAAARDSLGKLMSDSATVNNTRINLQAETKLRFARASYLAGDYGVSGTHSAQIAQFDLAGGVRDRARLAESAAIAALSANALGDLSSAARWAKIAVWFGQFTSDTRSQLVVKKLGELEPLANTKIANLGVDGLPVAATDFDEKVDLLKNRAEAAITDFDNQVVIIKDGAEAAAKNSQLRTLKFVKEYNQKKDIARTLLAVHSSAASKAQLGGEFIRLTSSIVQSLEANAKGACRDFLVAGEYAIENNDTFSRDVFVQLSKKLDNVLSAFKCEEVSRPRFIALRVQLALELGEPALGTLEWLIYAQSSTQRTGRVSKQHPLYQAALDVVKALEDSNLMHLAPLLYSALPNLFAPDALYKPDNDDTLLDALQSESQIGFVNSNALLRLIWDDATFVKLANPAGAKIGEKLASLEKQLEEIGRNDEANFVQSLVPAAESKHKKTKFKVAIDTLVETWNSGSNQQRLEVAISDVVEKAKEVAAEGKPLISSGFDTRISELERNVRRVAELAGDAFDSRSPSIGFRLADTVLVLTQILPTETSSDLAWTALGSILRASTYLGDFEPFRTRARDLLSRDAQAVQLNPEGALSFRTNMKIIAAYQIVASDSEMEDLLSPLRAIAEHLRDGTVSINNRNQYGLFQEALFGQISPRDPASRLKALSFLKQRPEPSKEITEFVGGATDRIVGEALAFAINDLRSGNLQEARTLAAKVQQALRGLPQQNSAKLKGPTLAVRAVAAVCSASTAEDAETSLDSLSRQMDSSAELAVERTLFARGLSHYAGSRIADVFTRLDVAGEPVLQTANKNVDLYRIKLSEFQGAASLLDGQPEKARSQLAEAWDRDKLNARRKQFAFAHTVLSMGRIKTADELFENLNQATKELEQAFDQADASGSNLEGRHFAVDRADAAFLEARLRLVHGDPEGALESVDQSRKRRDLKLFPTLQGPESDRTFSTNGSLLNAIAGTQVKPIGPLWQGAPTVPAGLWEPSAPPDSPLLVALTAADLIRKSGKSLSKEQSKIVRAEVRAATRSSTTVTMERARTIAGITDAGTKEALRRSILTDRSTRLASRSQSTGQWPPKPREVGDALAEYTPCEGGDAQKSSLSLRDFMFDALAPATGLWSEQTTNNFLLNPKTSSGEVLLSDNSDSLSIASDEAALFLTGSGKEVFTTVIRDSAIEVYKVAFEDREPSLDELVQQARKAISESSTDPSVDRTSIAALSRKILWPLLPSMKGVHRVFLITQGPLTSIPFHLLHLPPETETSSRTVWLDQAYSVRVLPGLDLLYPPPIKSDRTPPPTQSDLEFFAIADPAGFGDQQHCRDSMLTKLRNTDGAVDPSKFSEFCSVPETKLAAKAIALTLLSPNLANDLGSWLLTGSDARELKVTSDSRLGRARVVMFATHGLLADESLATSGLKEPALLLTPPIGVLRPIDRDDGLLTAGEITSLNLSADWVVLEACNSGGPDGGKEDEALSGLAAAFIAAGAHGVIVSYWRLDARTSIGLLRELFRAWDKGKLPMDQALVIAMQAIRDGKVFPGTALRTEFHWAPFVVVAR
ncbi:CHAT domain-containing protein [Bradyrhizobium erythrophlei]|uniref:CHAT domain-containing protein n=1 Tax=Bradyrhizobium erythrophlei TaxID=1437360 RepID=A0A1M5KUB4_9BRAD|nr:CHAT domain-containing protein [Bradyrhizobium erythrophlei]SHG56358.1 CHAT domain-containing protein [Bradyrhizobium erythrophlei]